MLERIARLVYTRVMQSVKKHAAAKECLVSLWLCSLAALVLLMMVVGALTRLTESGLSMVDWRPIMGALPPLSEVAWQDTFAAYQQFPEYQLLNEGMTLEAFKGIFMWEYTHRLLGRLLGLFLVVPLACFWCRKYLSKAMKVHGILLFVLGGLQGLLGWFMVQSGLVDNPWVSPFRLGAHLLLAMLVFVYIVLLLWQRACPRKEIAAEGSLFVLRAAGVLVLACCILQIFYGALVAGLDAGYAYNSFPKMQGAWLPAVVFEQVPVWKNLFYNPAGVQWIHRGLAYGLSLAVVLLAVWMRAHTSIRMRVFGYIALGLVALQFALGVATLLSHVGLALAVLHQIVACFLLSSLSLLVFESFRMGREAT